MSYVSNDNCNDDGKINGDRMENFVIRMETDRLQFDKERLAFGQLFDLRRKIFIWQYHYAEEKKFCDCYTRDAWLPFCVPLFGSICFGLIHFPLKKYNNYIMSKSKSKAEIKAEINSNGNKGYNRISTFTSTFLGWRTFPRNFSIILLMFTMYTGIKIAYCMEKSHRSQQYLGKWTKLGKKANYVRDSLFNLNKENITYETYQRQFNELEKQYLDYSKKDNKIKYLLDEPNKDSMLENIWIAKAEDGFIEREKRFLTNSRKYNLHKDLLIYRYRNFPKKITFSKP